MISPSWVKSLENQPIFNFIIFVQFLNVGIVGSIEANHKPVEVARKSQEVCIKIEGAPGEAPKMVGRHFDEQDVLTSKVRKFVLFAIFILHSRESELYRYTLDGKSALAWELPFLRFMGHLSST